MQSLYFIAGKIGHAHGLQGGFFITPSLELPLSFYPEAQAKVRIDSLETKVKSFDQNAKAWKVDAFTTRNEIESLRHKTIEVEITSNSPFFEDLAWLGWNVITNQNLELGTIKAVKSFGAQKNLIIDGEKEFIFPKLPQFIHSVDESKKTICVEHVEAFLE